MNRVAIYCRLSDEDRNKKDKTVLSESIQNQKSILTEYCEKNNWKIQGIYCDEDMSGADKTRPEFLRMLEECKKGNVDIVLCKTQSRFSREIETVEHYIHGKFTEWGVRFIGLLDYVDTEDVRNKKSRQINGLINEWYLEDLSENVKKTLRHKKEQGIYTGSFAPYGYKLLKETPGKLFIDDESAEIVRRIYSMYEQGAGYVKIAQKLNQEGILSPYRYKQQNGSKFKTHNEKITSCVWNESTVRSILKNEVYSGTLVQGKTETVSYKSKMRRKIDETDYIRTKNAHEPIIEPKAWKEINKRMNSRKRAQKTGKRHIFSGKIFCAECGSAMWKMSYKLKDGRYEYLKCKSTKCANLCTNTKSIKLDTVKEIVKNEIKKLTDKFCDYDTINIEKLNEMKNLKNQENENAIKSRILKHKLNIKQLYKDKLNDIIDNEIFLSCYNEISGEIFVLEKTLAEIKEEKISQKKFSKEIPIDEYTLHNFIDKILIGRETENKRKITIYFKI